MIAEIIINSIAKDLNKNFDYIVPETLVPNIKIGARVFVPFGSKRKEEGYVINLKENSEFANKEIISIEDNLLNDEKINLAKLMARRYFCNISDCIRLMLPPGNTSKNFEKRVKERKENFVYLAKKTEEIEKLIETKKIKSEKQIQALRVLKENEGMYITDLKKNTDVSKQILKTLEKNGYIKILEEKVQRNPLINRKIEKDKPLELTKEQQTAFNRIKDSKFKEFLIYGVTGSRKNRSLFTINSKCIRKE